MKIITTMTLFLLMTLSLFAQPTLPSDPSQSPIEGGLLWLLIGGGAYGIKKLRDLKQNQTTNKGDLS